jgi:hypothetical protein
MTIQCKLYVIALHYQGSSADHFYSFPHSKFTGDPRFSFQPSPSTSLGSQHCKCFKDGDDTPITLTDCAVNIGCDQCCNNAGYSDTKRCEYWSARVRV